MAEFLAPGAVDMFFGLRRTRNFLNAAAADSSWFYLGTAVTAPEVETSYIQTPVTCDFNFPAPFQKIHHGEQAIITATLNRLNYNNLSILKATASIDGDPEVYSFRPGKLVLNAYDFCLYLQNTNTNPSKGRLYLSATLLALHETNINSRVKECSLIFECNSLYVVSKRSFWMYTEKPEDLPVLKPE